MIRTMVEVDGKDEWEFEKNLNAALDKLGFQPKSTPDETDWRRDLYRGMVAKGLEPQTIVDEYRKSQGDA